MTLAARADSFSSLRAIFRKNYRNVLCKMPTLAVSLARFFILRQYRIGTELVSRAFWFVFSLFCSVLCFFYFQHAVGRRSLHDSLKAVAIWSHAKEKIAFCATKSSFRCIFCQARVLAELAALPHIGLGRN